MAGKPIDNRGDYSPANCQWITLAENSGKDKIIFSDNEKIKIYQERKKIRHYADTNGRTSMCVKKYNSACRKICS